MRRKHDPEIEQVDQQQTRKSGDLMIDDVIVTHLNPNHMHRFTEPWSPRNAMTDGRLTSARESDP